MPASCCCRKVGKSCVKGPLKPLPGRTPFLSPSPLVYILDQPRPSATSPPIPPLPGPQQLEVLRGPPSSVWRRQASLRLALSVHLLATARCGSPFGGPALSCLHFRITCCHPSLAPCSLLPARQPVRAASLPSQDKRPPLPSIPKGLDNVRTAGSDTAGTAASSLTRETQPTPFGDAD